MRHHQIRRLSLLISACFISLICTESALAEPSPEEMASAKASTKTSVKTSLKPSSRSTVASSSDPAQASDERAQEIARAVVNRWASAQNESSIEKYSTLFAEDFVGIRRAGRKRTKLKRAAWLKERRRMFRKSPKIAVTALKTQVIAPDRVEATFTQRWTSALYEDIGPKRLLIDIASGLILEEEMISSTVIKNLFAVARALGVKGKASSITCRAVPKREGLLICVVDGGDGQLRAEYIAALVRKTSAGYTALDTVSGDSEVETPEHQEDGGSSLEWSFQRIAPHKRAIVITTSASSEGGWGDGVDDFSGSDSSETCTWYAIEEESLHPILEVNSGGHSDQEYSGEFTQITIKPTQQLVRGHFTLRQTTEVTAWGDDVQASAQAPKVTTSHKILVWDAETRTYRALK